MYDHYDQKGYLYIIEGDPGICKIGRSVNHPEKRLSGVNHGWWLDMNLRYISHTRGYKQIEILLHELFKHHHLRGEWFRIQPEDVVHYSKTTRKFPGVYWEKYFPVAKKDSS